ncbi:G-protein beta subunit-like protein (contains WD40 repeats) protein [Dioscorea alata]|uniref:G-protein beta subunit-like protein (Contains WD40 repeats) protein n=1 Tax=Dioscorea alata TaxID=55571 RepID=A0ACB7W222_DIOAL|nr:G-protein beta subunit-like protein (contains WD40 repeats) protein [Dioscorea alata]
MPLPRTSSCCFSAGGGGSVPSPPASTTINLTTSTASDSSTSSDVPSLSSNDDAVSIITLPSLPSLLLLPPISSLPISSHLCLSSLPPSSSSLSLALSPSHLFTASDLSISIYDLSTLDLLASFPVSSRSGSAKSLSFSSDGRYLLSSHQDGRIRLWPASPNPRRLSQIATLPTLSDRLLRLPLPKNYISIRRHCKRLWIEHADAVSSLAAHQDLIYSASWDKTLKIWRSSDLRCLESIPAHEDAINAIAVAGDGTVYTGSADRRIRVWTKTPGEKRHSLMATLEKHRSAVNALALSPDGAVLYSGACDRSILVWEREDSANYMVVSGALRGHQRAVMSLVCVGDVLFSGSSDRTVRIWRRGGDGKYACLGVMEGHTRGVRSVVAVPVPAAVEEGEEEFRVCSGSLDGEVRIWKVRISSFPKSYDS